MADAPFPLAPFFFIRVKCSEEMGSLAYVHGFIRTPMHVYIHIYGDIYMYVFKDTHIHIYMTDIYVHT